jgi:hypothetical protein
MELETKKDQEAQHYVRKSSFNCRVCRSMRGEATVSRNLYRITLFIVRYKMMTARADRD